MNKRARRGASKAQGQRDRFRFRPKPHGEAVSDFGALGAGAVGVALANVVGIGELAVGVCVAFICYRILRFGETPRKALIEGFELRHEGKVPRRAKSRAA